jgi:hypothetical protein
MLAAVFLLDLACRAALRVVELVEASRERVALRLG